jgi:hypothetical protein
LFRAPAGGHSRPKAQRPPLGVGARPAKVAACELGNGAVFLFAVEAVFLFAVENETFSGEAKQGAKRKRVERFGPSLARQACIV